MGGHPSRPAVAGRLERSTRRHRAGSPRTPAQDGGGPPSLSTLLRVGSTEPHRSPGVRWSLTPPFHPYQRTHRRSVLRATVPMNIPGAVATHYLDGCSTTPTTMGDERRVQTRPRRASEPRRDQVDRRARRPPAAVPCRGWRPSSLWTLPRRAADPRTSPPCSRSSGGWSERGSARTRPPTTSCRRRWRGCSRPSTASSRGCWSRTPSRRPATWWRPCGAATTAPAATSTGCSTSASPRPSTTGCSRPRSATPSPWPSSASPSASGRCCSPTRWRAWAPATSPTRSTPPRAPSPPSSTAPARGCGSST